VGIIHNHTTCTQIRYRHHGENQRSEIANSKQQTDKAAVLKYIQVDFAHSPCWNTAYSHRIPVWFVVLLSLQFKNSIVCLRNKINNLVYNFHTSLRSFIKNFICLYISHDLVQFVIAIVVTITQKLSSHMWRTSEHS